MREDLTSVTVVLDRSGSMTSVASDTIGGFNSFIAEQKTEPGDCLFTLALFDSEYTLVHDNVKLSEVPDLTTKTYVPRGNTALLDAVGRTINAVGANLASMKEEERPAKVVFVIMTDGQENSSKEFTKTKIASMIEHQQSVYKWKFAFIGADMSAIDEAVSWGVTKGNTFQYTSDSRGTKGVLDMMSKSVRRYRSNSVSKGQKDDLFDKNK